MSEEVNDNVSVLVDKIFTLILEGTWQIPTYLKIKMQILNFKIILQQKSVLSTAIRAFTVLKL